MVFMYSVSVRPIHPRDRLYNPGGVGSSGKHCPPLARFVPVFHHTGVIGQVTI